MTPKEKAQQIFDKCMFACYECDFTQNAKDCALIVADEIIDAIDWHEFETPNKQINYWLDVRKEINKL